MPTSFSVGGASIATANGRFLTSWTVNTTTGNRADGMAIDENGKPESIGARRLIGSAMTSKIFPRGSEFLLSYEDAHYYRHFMRLSKDGAPQGDAGLPVFTNAPGIFGSQDGRRILVQRSDSGWKGELLDENGAIVKSGIPLNRPGIPLNGSVVPAGDGFLIVSAEETVLGVRALHSNGEVDPAPLIVDNPAPGAYLSNFVAAVAGSRLLLLWNVRFPPGPLTIAGVVIENGAVTRRLSISVNDFVTSKLLWTGQQFALFGSTGQYGAEQIAAMRFDSNGGAIDHQPVVLTDSQSRHLFSDAAWNGSTFNVVGSTNYTNVIGINVGPSLTSPWTTVLSVLPARQTAPAMAAGDGSLMAVWSESGSDGASIRAAIVRSGEAIEPFTLTTGKWVPATAVAYGGGMYLIAWESYQEVLGVRITSSGMLLDPQPLSIARKSGGQSYSDPKPAIAWNGSAFLVAWTDNGVHGAFVTKAGTVGMDRMLIEAAEEPALAWNGETFLLAGTIRRSTPVGEVLSDVVILTLAADATPAVTPPSTWKYVERPSVATSGHECLITGTETFHGQLLGMWTDNRGAAVGTPFRIAQWLDWWEPARSWPAAAVAWSGSSYLVAAHSRAVSWSLQIDEFQPLSVTPFSTRKLASRPDWGRATSTAFGIENGRAWLLFDDVSDEEAPGGSSRMMISPVDELPVMRRRAVSR